MKIKEKPVLIEQPRTNTYQFGLAEIVVHRPCIEDNERRKREEVVLRAMSAFGRETTRQKIAAAQ